METSLKPSHTKAITIFKQKHHHLYQFNECLAPPSLSMLLIRSQPYISKRAYTNTVVVLVAIGIVFVILSVVRIVGSEVGNEVGRLLLLTTLLTTEFGIANMGARDRTALDADGKTPDVALDTAESSEGPALDVEDDERSEAVRSDDSSPSRSSKAQVLRRKGRGSFLSVLMLWTSLSRLVAADGMLLAAAEIAGTGRIMLVVMLLVGLLLPMGARLLRGTGAAALLRELLVGGETVLLLLEEEVVEEDAGLVERTPGSIEARREV
ncbi:hypothetical protein HDK90DRAFT_492990 [Phyllosticta capitalensis]|uniref:Uncharacterized protein n=1 Tax=Phyllosticta capitalensis TaxID=121624 RepID=A0ABR1YGT8_9PEZI